MKKTFAVKGMNCASCAGAIEKALSKTAGVKSAAVNFAAEKATIEWDEKKAAVEKMVEAVRKTGYELAAAETPGTEILRLKVIGMESGHCAMIVEQAVKSLSGVKSAAADFANSRAKIVYETAKTNPRAIQKAIIEAGYKPIIAEGKKEEREGREKREKNRELKILKTKLFFGILLSLAITLGTYWPRFGWRPQPAVSVRFFILWLLAIPVQFWVGRQFYRGLTLLVRYKTADMNTLIALGTLAAFGYSTAVTFFPQVFERGGLAPEVYFDTAAIIITLVLTGRFLEARAKGQAGEAIKKLMGLQPKEAAVLLAEGDERGKRKEESEKRKTKRQEGKGEKEGMRKK